ncbi:hypothetical protein [Mycobacterium sp. E1747]|uniref:hypothetical protein n=1 Tax=Mycobacterium sp. E1747 TaxID=1834128 RepID=UPI000AC9952B|nr:hypothetical protein [Mycobacterium sp. E1747]
MPGFTPRPARHRRAVPPTLEQRNDEVLSGLSLTADEAARPRADRVIGERPLGA